MAFTNHRKLQNTVSLRFFYSIIQFYCNNYFLFIISFAFMLIFFLISFSIEPAFFNVSGFFSTCFIHVYSTRPNVSVYNFVICIQLVIWNDSLICVVWNSQGVSNRCSLNSENHCNSAWTRNIKSCCHIIWIHVFIFYIHVDFYSYIRI